MHFNGRFVVNLAQIASHQGADINEILSISQKPYEELCSEDCKLDSATYNAVLEECVHQTKDELFGLHAGENLNLQAAGLIVQIAHSASTVKEALEYCCEFANLGCSALPTELVKDDESYKLTLKPNPIWLAESEESVVHTIYGYLAFTIKEYQSITRSNDFPDEIWLTSIRPDNYKELERVVGCPVKFEQGENAIFFSKDKVEKEVVTSDYNLLQVLVAHANSKMEQMAQGHGFYNIVRKSVLNLVKPEFPTIEQVAAHLNMSVRTFQRKLSDEGHSYKALVDELRQEFAMSYLKDDTLSINEIAYLLSYADASAFIRSFKRWTGKTPSEYRS